MYGQTLREFARVRQRKRYRAEERPVAEMMRGGRRERTGGARGPGQGGAAGADVLTSRDNRWLKEFRVALRGGVPTADGAVGVEGARLVEEALTSGCRVAAVLFSESGERYRERLARFISRPEMGFPVLKTMDRLFEGIADTEHPQGVAALVVPRKWTLEELVGVRGEWRQANSDREEDGTGMPKGGMRPLDRLSGQRAEGVETPQQSEEGQAPLIVVLAGVQDPGNVGAILRTAAAFGATGAVTAATGQSGTASPFAPKALRASAGAALHLPMVSGMALGILLTQLRLHGVRTLASCTQEKEEERRFHTEDVEGSTQRARKIEAGGYQISDIRYQEGKTPGATPGAPADALAPWEVDWCQPIALLVGNEGAGLPEEVVRAADARVRIPMAALPSSGQARVESLNAGAAAAVVLYEAFRQRKRTGAGRLEF